MSAGTNSIALPEGLLRDISQQASLEGVAPEDWVLNALAERIREQKQADEFFRRRAAGAKGISLGEILNRIPQNDREPDPGDEL